MAGDKQQPANAMDTVLLVPDLTAIDLSTQCLQIENTDNTYASINTTSDIETFNLAGDLAHFEVIETIGQGGMGKVYRARDKTLQRDVALKLLRFKTNQHLTEQAQADVLLDEARLICKLNHHNVVTVFDIARAQDSNFIVMEWIDGQSLDKIIPPQGLPLNTAVDYACQIIDGINCAHQSGIIHSDIKPLNIMLTGEGVIKILDFGISGLASSQNPDNDTTQIHNSLKVFGSAGYMSPEQAMGAQSLDKRVDIFAFGIVFYQMLTGQKPFQGDNAIACNHAVLSGKYSPLNPQLPKDLRAIVNRCLAHIPDDRYQSASQLSDDLQRFVRGDAVSIINSRGYWLNKTLRKHKWPTLLVLLLSLVGVGELIWQQYQSTEQQIREQHIATFTSRVENLEAQVQLSKLSPRHDVTAEAAQWRQQIITLGEEINTLGEAAYGPGHYAIGRMYYALQHYDEALVNLQQAWDSGFVQTRVAYNLALSHGAIYQRQKAIINNISNRSARKDKMAQLDAKHRQPAIDYLEQGMDHSPSQVYAQALLQYYQGQGDAALITLAQAKQFPVWFYLHHRLRGDIYLAKADDALNTHDETQSLSHITTALKHYNQALAFGRSDLHLQLRPVAVYFKRLTSALYGKEQDFNNTYLKAMTVLNQTTRIRPNSYLPYLIRGRLLYRKAEYQDQHSGDPIATQQQAIKQLQLALARADGNADVLLSLGMAYMQNIKLLQDRGLPVEQAFEPAINTFESISLQNRDYFYYNRYASLQLTQAIHIAQQQQTGILKNPLEVMNQRFQQSIDAYHQASQLRPKRIGAKINAGSVYRRWSKFVAPVMAQHKLKQAIEHYQSAHVLNPKNFVVNYYLGMSYRWLARLNDTQLIAKKDELAQAEVYIAQTKQLNPQHPFAVVQMAKLATEQAIYHWQQGQPYQDDLALAKNTLAQALMKHSDNNTLLDNRAWVYRIQAQLNYFDPQITNRVNTNDTTSQYNEALNKAKNILSTKLEDYYLIRLLTNQWHAIEQADIDALPSSVNASLAKAQWYSQSGRYEQAEQHFDAIEQYFPSLLWLYRLEHLQRWTTAAQQNSALLSSQQKHSLNQQISQLNKQLQQHFPALMATSH